LVNGTPIIFTVRPPVALKSLSATWLDHHLEFSFDPRTQTWNAFAGVSLNTKPGSYSLQLNATAKSGAALSYQKAFAIAKANYPSSSITVARQYTEPSPEQLQEINRDKAIKQDYFTRVTGQRRWSGNFFAPADARISDVFGSTRTFNGQVQSTHEGLDYAVPTGTAVHAVNRGTVLLVQALYFEGYCVVIDHGQGLLSLYLHLSRIDVKEGEAVTTGQTIGLSGGTGRATGPHLHLAIRWQGVYVDPRTLLQLPAPETPAP
jgi:murein DD-endopeptidase MepM/ murein hydrolase activator NlpD